MLSAAAWRRVSRRIVAACSRSASEDWCRCSSICCRDSGASWFRVVLKSVQSAFLKLKRWEMGWVAVSSRGAVVRSNRITSWLDPVVASSSTAQLVMVSADVGVAKVRSRMDVPVPFL